MLSSPRYGEHPYVVTAYHLRWRDVGCTTGMTLLYMEVCSGWPDKDNFGCHYNYHVYKNDGDDDDALARALLDNCALALLPGISPREDPSGRAVHSVVSR